MARSDNRIRVPAEIVVGAFVAAGSLPLGRLFASGPIAPLILGTILMSGVVAWLLRRTRLIAPLGAVVSAFVWFWFAGIVFYHGKTLLLLPTPAMFASVAHAIAAGIRSSTTEVAPIPPLPWVLLLVSMIVWAAVWLADDALQKLRHPLLAIGFVLPIFVFPGTLLDSPHRVVDVGLFLAGALAVLFVDESKRLARWGRTAGIGLGGWRSGLAFRIGAVVTVLAVVSAPFVPGYGRPPGGGAAEAGDNGAAGARVTISPLVSIRPRLSSTQIIPLFTVISPQPSYWRLTSLGTFTGTYWLPLAESATQMISDLQTSPSPTPARASLIHEQVTIDSLGGPWLPAAYQPIEVFDRGGVHFGQDSRTLFPSTPIQRGDSYGVDSVIADPSAEALNAITSIPSTGLSEYLHLPPTPQVVVALAKSWTESDSTPFERAVSLQNHLRTFTYDEQVKAGHDFKTLEEFLTKTKRGYCEQFAGSMAVLARILGIPSRVAIGFSTGNAMPDQRYLITSRHAHAWVELWFPGYGWLPFEPTPRTDGTMIVPSYTQPAGSQPSQSAAAAPVPSVSGSPSAAPTKTKKNLSEQNTGATVTTSKKTPAWLFAILVLVAIALLAAVGLPGAGLLKRRIRLRRAGPDTREIVAAHYLDFLDWCAAAGFPKAPGETPAEYSCRLGQISAPAEAPLAQLADLAAYALWAPSDVEDHAEALIKQLGHSAERAIAATLPMRLRLRPALGWGWWRR
ncbi:MAG: transglutaminase TgpA family protein [Actinomycetota bacterium]